jgi:hypothetical protein
MDSTHRDLFEALRENMLLATESGVYSSKALTLSIIALKHSFFFIATRKRAIPTVAFPEPTVS